MNEREMDTKPESVGAHLGVESTSGRIVTALAVHPPGTLLDEKALAAALGVSTRTIRRMVDRYELPPGVKLGARKIWMVNNVLDFLNERAERDADRARKQVRRLSGTSDSW